MLPTRCVPCAREPAFEHLDGGRPNLRFVVLGSAMMGALVSGVFTYALTAGIQGNGVEPAKSAQDVGTARSSIEFKATRAQEALGELTATEVRAVAAWYAAQHSALSPIHEASPTCSWIAGPSGVELLRPPKSETVAYLDGKGSPPQRFARITVAGPVGVEEYAAGPIENGTMAPDAKLEPLLREPVPYTRRPTEPQADYDLASGVINHTLKVIGATLLEQSFGKVWPQFPSFTGEAGSIFGFLRNDALAPPGSRMDLVKFMLMPPAHRRPEAFWLHPVPLAFKLNSSSPDPKEWHVLDVYYCGQGPWKSASELAAASARKEVRACSVSKYMGTWDVPQKVTPPSPAGRQLLESHGGVSWGPWSFTVTQRPSTGIALLDVRFKGERVLYELSLQEAQAAYSGSRESQFFYSDASWSLSMLSASLEPGVDCPEGAHYVSAVNWYKMTAGGGARTDPQQAEEDFWPICVFEWVEDHTIWRHRQNYPNDVRGLLRRTLVVRSVATVGNYDYLMDIKLREDGEIEVHTRFAGFIESRYFDAALTPAERNFSTIVRKDLAGPVHSHLVSWKADFDVAGVRANALRVTRVRARPVAEEKMQAAAEGGKEIPQRQLDAMPEFISKQLEHQVISEEGVGKSTFVADPHLPGTWAIVDQAAQSEAGNPRGYAVTLNSWATTQVLPADHPFARAQPFTKYHLAVTKYHDDEYRVNSPYVQYDGGESTPKGGQNLDLFLADGENLVDEDLVAWIGIGREHVVRQEDLPLVSNFGGGFSLQPWNFFTGNVASNPPQ